MLAMVAVGEDGDGRQEVAADQEHATRAERSSRAVRLPRLLGGILDPAARRRGFAEASLLADWATIVGPVLARRCQPVRIDHPPGRRQGGTLLLQAGGGVALELQHAAPQLLERINTYFGHRVVRQLRLLQMPLPPRRAPSPPPTATVARRGRGDPRRRRRRGRGQWTARGASGPRPHHGTARARDAGCAWRPCRAGMRTL